MREILEICEIGILICVHTKGSRKRRKPKHSKCHVFDTSDNLLIVHEEAVEFFGSEGYPHINLTYVVTTYLLSVNAALARLAEDAISAEEPPMLLSDPKFLLLGPMGYVRPPAASKAWEKRFSREGPIRRGFPDKKGRHAIFQTSWDDAEYAGADGDGQISVSQGVGC